MGLNGSEPPNLDLRVVILPEGGRGIRRHYLTMTNEAAIRVENLSKRYRIGEHVSYRTLRETITDCLKKPFGRLSGSDKTAARGFQENGYIWALKEISLEVKAGEVVGIIGPNGAGKSTLLKILSRITKPTAGYAEIHGRAGSLLEVGTGFHPELTGRENVYLNGAVLGMRKAEIKQKYGEIVAFAEIGKFIDTPVKRYSSGMYVRLAFSVAAHMEPEILLVDEVLAVGDAGFQKKCLGKMGEVGKEGRTVLFVSHQMSAIRTLCKRTIWLDAGRILRQGSSSEVVREYENSYLGHSLKLSPVVARDNESVKDRSFYIHRVEVLNTTNKTRNVISYNNSLTLIVTLSGQCKSNEYSLEFRIYKLTGEFVAVGSSGAYHNLYFDKKTKQIRIDIGPLALTNGTYFVSLSLVTGMTRPDTWEKACYFDIAGCHPFRSGRDVDKSSICVVQQSFRAEE
jgi:lipopolysaccharide transport system ATP-binding protein